MSKKFLIFLPILILVSLINLTAQPGGFTGPGLLVGTIQEARTFRDGTPVLLQGRILRSLGDEKYLFADDTGTIVVEINERLWRGITVSENDRVEIVGEVEKEFLRIEIEASRIRKLD